MIGSCISWRTLAGFVLVLFLASMGGAAVPSGFVDELLVGGIQYPTDVAFAPDGRIFVAEKQGKIRVFKNGAILSSPLIDLTSEIGGQGDRGLLSITLHPNFAQSPYIYLLYVVDPIYGVPDEAAKSVTYGRLTRYTISGDTASGASRLVLLGNSAADGFPHCDSSHAIGRVRFGPDGMLFASAGDGAHYDRADDGTDVTIEDPDCAVLFGSAQDKGAYRSQLLTSLAGKVVRIDPATGLGLTTNPFYSGSATSIASRIWALGLRNPFRFCIKPGSTGAGILYVSEVGWSTWEELNVARTGGANFGWPCWEGASTQSQYQANSIIGPLCQGTPSGTLTPPLITWHHTTAGSLGFIGNASTGSAFYTASNFPSHYAGACFFADYGKGWIKAAFVNSSDQLISIESFADGLANPISLEVDPATGGLVYLSISGGEVRRIRYTTGNNAPSAVASASPTAGSAPLAVQFSSNGTVDPDGDPVTFEWNFGDGTALSTAANPLHTYTSVGNFTARLTARDNRGGSSQATVAISSSNNPPHVDLTSPLDSYRFTLGNSIQFAATASDPEDGTNLAWQWKVDLIHNNHIHPGYFISNDAIPPAFIFESDGTPTDRISYILTVTVTDTFGLTATDSMKLLPVILPANSAPVASFLAQPVSGIAPLLVNLDATASSDLDGDWLAFTWNFGDGTTGSGATTSHVYTAPGTYPVALTAADMYGGLNTITSSILAKADVAPVANNQSNTMTEDGTLNLTLNYSDSDGGPGPYTVTILTPPSKGILTGTGATRTYKPNPNLNGADSFTWRVNDGQLNSNTATYSITINAVNDPPAFTTDPVIKTKGYVGKIYTDTLSTSVLEPDGNALTYSKLSGPAWLAVAANGALSGTPSASDLGTFTWGVRVVDSTGLLDDATLQITVETPVAKTLFSDGFESGNLTAGGWTSSGNVSASTSSRRTGTYGAQIRKVSSLERTISTSNTINVHVKYDRRAVGLDSGEYLYVEWFNGSAWMLIEQTNSTAWASKDILLPATANYQPGFRIRFRTTASKNPEGADIDNVSIIGQ